MADTALGLRYSGEERQGLCPLWSLCYRGPLITESFNDVSIDY